MPYSSLRKRRVADRLRKRQKAAARRAAAAENKRVPTLRPIRLESANDVLRLLRRTLTVLDRAEFDAADHVRLALSVARAALPAVETALLEERLAKIEATLRERGLLT